MSDGIQFEHQNQQQHIQTNMELLRSSEYASRSAHNVVSQSDTLGFFSRL
jgi:hypothetical protein